MAMAVEAFGNQALVTMGVATYFSVICMGEGTGEALAK